MWKPHGLPRKMIWYPWISMDIHGGYKCSFSPEIPFFTPCHRLRQDRSFLTREDWRGMSPGRTRPKRSSVDGVRSPSAGRFRDWRNKPRNNPISSYDILCNIYRWSWDVLSTPSCRGSSSWRPEGHWCVACNKFHHNVEMIVWWRWSELTMCRSYAA